MKITRLKKKTTILVLPDMHFPWANWKAIKMAYKWAQKHQPDYVIQLGDILDAKAWSRWPKDPDDPSPQQEFDMAAADLEKLHKLFPELYILNGNHDLRFQVKAFESSIPSSMLRGLDELFEFDGWTWLLDPNENLVVPSSRGDILFMHGDEMGGRPINKAVTLGYNVVQGHTHKTSTQYVQTLDKFYFGHEAGHLMDVHSKAARYSARNPLGTCCGFTVIKHGIPYWIPADLGRV